MRLLTRLKQSLCTCNSCADSPGIALPDYIKTGGREVLGVTLSWGWAPTPFYRWPRTCTKCGRQWHFDGILPSPLWHRDCPPDENGWPTLNGDKLAIYHAPR